MQNHINIFFNIILYLSITLYDFLHEIFNLEIYSDFEPNNSLKIISIKIIVTDLIIIIIILHIHIQHFFPSFLFF